MKLVNRFTRAIDSRRPPRGTQLRSFCDREGALFARAEREELALRELRAGDDTTTFATTAKVAREAAEAVYAEEGVHPWDRAGIRPCQGCTAYGRVCRVCERVERRIREELAL